MNKDNKNILNSKENNISQRSSKKTLIGLISVVSVWAMLCICCFFKPQTDFSDSERRKLATFPNTSAESILSGKFMTDFESYSLDQFPLRDSFRTLKAITAIYGFGMKDNNNIYSVDGYTAKIEYPLNENSVTSAASKFKNIYEKYIEGKNSNVYLSVIPDKGYFLAKKHGYPTIDYSKVNTLMQKGMPFAKYIDIFPTLSLEDYYKTDTHWKQENLSDTAEKILTEMGAETISNPVINTADKPFYGVYYGQSALPLASEQIKYITSPTIEKCVVTNMETGKTGGIYNMEKLDGKDPYEMYLSGACALLYIDNPNAQTKRELIIFRDSFGSSLAPLLVESYSKITIVDTRYILSELVGNYVTFENSDVLFIYSSMILNNSNTLR